MSTSLESLIRRSAPAIESWFQREWAVLAPPVYSSVDVRRAGFKLAPVDTNLFPGGWNNLTPDMWSLAAQAARAVVQQRGAGVKNLLLIPENHTRNPFYLQNVAQLCRVLRLAGLKVRMGSLDPSVQSTATLALPDGELLTLEPVIREGQRLMLAGFEPDAVLLNNDLSAGVPAVLRGLQGQPLWPPLKAGWHVRRKSAHFRHYAAVARRFANALDIDPWCIDPLFDHCPGVDFAKGLGLDELQHRVDALLASIRCKYRQHGVEAAPFVIVKADNGTYGMGVMTVRDASELERLNRRTRNKMGVIKEGQAVTQVLLQEGVPTIERVHGAVAEPVVYLMGAEAVGGFYRVHASRGADENLNAPGAAFVPLALAPDGRIPAHFYPDTVLARLAALAASHELAQADSTAAVLPREASRLCEA